jgi:hypothetical protein
MIVAWTRMPLSIMFEAPTLTLAATPSPSCLNTKIVPRETGPALGPVIGGPYGFHAAWAFPKKLSSSARVSVEDHCAVMLRMSSGRNGRGPVANTSFELGGVGKSAGNSFGKDTLVPDDGI